MWSKYKSLDYILKINNMIMYIIHLLLYINANVKYNTVLDLIKNYNYEMVYICYDKHTKSISNTYYIKHIDSVFCEISLYNNDVISNTVRKAYCDIRSKDLVKIKDISILKKKYPNIA